MMKILGWVGEGDLSGSDRAEDHAPSGVMANDAATSNCSSKEEVG